MISISSYSWLILGLIPECKNMGRPTGPEPPYLPLGIFADFNALCNWEMSSLRSSEVFFC